MKDSLKKTVYIFTAVLLFFMITVIMNLAVTPGNIIPGTTWQIQSANETEPVIMPYIKTVKSSGTFTYSMRFTNPELEDPALIIIRPISHALEIRLNGEPLWKFSELSRPTGNIWNYSVILPLPGLVKGENTIIIKSAALHQTGFPTQPYIDDYHKSIEKVNLANFLFNDILLFTIGASFILGFLLLLLSISRKTAPDAAFYMGLAATTAAVFCIDYIFRISGGSPEVFLIQKKIFLVCGYVAAGSFLFAVSLYSEYGIKFRKPVFILTAVACTGIIAAWNFPVLYKVFKFSNFVLMLNLILGIIMLLKKLPEKETFLIPMCLLLLSICQVIIDSMLELAGPLSLQYILLVSTIFFSIHILLDFNHIFRENRQLAIGIHKDPLTGVFNRLYLKKMNHLQWDILVLADLDNFKYYNDTYGHGSGDQVLLLFAEIVQENLRTNDLLMRIGGDEFLIFLTKVDLRQADKILKRIEQQFKDRIDDTHIGFSYGIHIIDKDIDQVIAEADILMYDMKKSRKRKLQQAAL